MTGLRRRALVVFLLAAACASGLLGLEPRISTSIEAGSDPWVGRPATLSLLVEVDTWFTGGVDVPDFEVPGALVRRAPGRAVSSTSREGSTTWAGLKHSFLVYPLRPGEIEVPPIPIGIRYSVDGKSVGPVELTTEATSFRATVPEEAKGLGYFIVARSFVLQEEIEGMTAELRQGDALTRKITQRARDTLAMLLPPLEMEPVRGLGFYSAEPKIEDFGGERGEARQALRTDSATYVLEQVGTFVLPAMSVSWWNLKENRLQIAELAAVEIEVAENPDLAGHLGGEEGEAEVIEERVESQGNILEVLASLALLALAVWLLRPWLGKLWRAVVALETREPSPGKRELEAFREAARRGDAEGSYRFLTAWLDHTEISPSLGELVEGQQDPVLRKEVGRLSDHLFGSEGRVPWKAGDLVAAVDRAQVTRFEGSDPGKPSSELPPLNPR